MKGRFIGSTVKTHYLAQHLRNCCGNSLTEKRRHGIPDLLYDLCSIASKIKRVIEGLKSGTLARG